MDFEKHILKNGLRLILAPMKDTQTVAVQILVETGSKYEDKNNNGIAHFLEHMMFKGTKKRPKAKIISEQLDGVGADYNAFTGKEDTGYWIKVPKNKCDLALDIVSDIYLNSLLKQKDIDVERGVILQEAAMYRDTPMAYVFNIFEQLLYGDQPAGWKIIGEEKNIKRVQRQDFVDFVKKHYRAENTVVVVAGNFKKEKVTEKVKKLFLSIRTEKGAGKKKTKQKQQKPAIEIFKKKTEQTHLVLGVRSCDMFSKDRFAMSVLSAILGAGMSSRMFLNIREKHGLTYYINAANEQMTDSGYFFVSAGVKHDDLEKAINLIIKELIRIKEKKVKKKELRKAIDFLKGATLMGLESSDAVASFFGSQELFKHKIKQPEELFKKIEKITEDDIMKLAQKIFVNKGLNLAVISPRKDEGGLEKILKF